MGGSLTMEEMKSHTPEGLETPEYSVVENFHGALSPGEVRKYAEFSVCSLDIDETKNDKMSFVMPSNYWKGDRLSSAPAPIEGSNVVLEKARMDEMAVLWFDGYAVGSTVTERKQELLAAIEDSDDYELVTPDAKPIVMQYNDPFVLPWKRRNEVAVPVRERVSLA